MKEKIAKYYSSFSRWYDRLSPASYYLKPRKKAVKELYIKEGDTILVVACGTGQLFGPLQDLLKCNGLVIGLDLSPGMLSKAREKIRKNDWKNICLIEGNATELSERWLSERLDRPEGIQVDASICELGLSVMEDWAKVVDKMMDVTKPGGRIVVMDWYMEDLNFRGRIINYIGKADITRPTWKYLKNRSENFLLDRSFKKGDVFVASATVPE